MIFSRTEKKKEDDDSLSCVEFEALELFISEDNRINLRYSYQNLSLIRLSLWLKRLI